MSEFSKQAVVRHRDEIPPIDCPFGHVQRIVTGGEGGIANVHVVKITKGTPHLHQDNFSGTATISIRGASPSPRHRGRDPGRVTAGSLDVADDCPPELFSIS